MIDALQRLIWRLDNDPSLLEPNQLRQRFEALDLLDAYFPGADFSDTHEPVSNDESTTAGLYRQARAFCARLEAVNGELYETIRSEIQRGERPGTLLQWVPSSGEMEEMAGPVNGIGYDYLDELISGVFQFEEPAGELDQREPEMVFYQPTPVRHIFYFIGLTELTASDVVVDLGSGLGHVPLLVSICTGARSVGIELEPTYVECARQCAQRLNLNTVTFLHQDARVADLSSGTVFYLHTPFTGSIQRRVIDLLRSEAAIRQIRICTYGPCTFVLAAEPWLEAASAPETHRIALFCSRS